MQFLYMPQSNTHESWIQIPANEPIMWYSCVDADIQKLQDSGSWELEFDS